MQAVDSVWGRVYAVELHADAQGATIVTGKLRKSAAGGSRRLIGRVWAKVMDADGDVIAVYDCRPQRVSPARHTSLARFAITIDALPEGADAVRVGYR